MGSWGKVFKQLLQLQLSKEILYVPSLLIAIRTASTRVQEQVALRGHFRNVQSVSDSLVCTSALQV